MYITYLQSLPGRQASEIRCSSRLRKRMTFCEEVPLYSIPYANLDECSAFGDADKNWSDFDPLLDLVEKLDFYARLNTSHSMSKYDLRGLASTHRSRLPRPHYVIVVDGFILVLFFGCGYRGYWIFVDRVKPVFKGHSDEWTPSDMGTFSLSGVLSFLCWEKPVMKGHLSCCDTYTRILRCPLKTGFTVFYSTCFFVQFTILLLMCN